jgi:hypothetical protein
MRLGDEGVQAMEWAYGRLTQSQELADALGVALVDLPDRVWPDPAPGGTPVPFVVYSASETLDRNLLGPTYRSHTTVPLNVKGVDQSRDYTALAPVARAIYGALVARLNDPVADGGVILTATREGGIQYPETGDGIEYRHLGHLLSVEIN